MKTLPIGGSEVVSLPEYTVLTITMSAGATGTHERMGNNPGDASISTTAISTGTTAVGPFAFPTRHHLRCSPASLMSFDLSAADFPAVNSDFERIAKLTQAEYDALSPPDPATLYLIVG
ncbi:hypothetical protein EN868_11665 [Mesorhizobium sp. M2D.F.Ca.ET.225.01.1.1]|uniref:phage upper tail fiber protein n=1 Tax=unclassified Mesorhizobium TaxID=325217 RepID=UPI000FD3EEE6|nr:MULTISPECIES: hypothetical protein [unclassified Mesorhizobium]TGP55773.1 hypothetical protein EN869_025475 [Mesorhizobium sp. M2D.F.Ca.ET.226.01.1.1]TGP68231.1 hypothetical protein EN868_11665 [Mesorhizobium sp. M2D.F.Ca.ET.225.01.1.1]